VLLGTAIIQSSSIHDRSVFRYINLIHRRYKLNKWGIRLIFWQLAVRCNQLKSNLKRGAFCKIEIRRAFAFLPRVRYGSTEVN
jgi:hypothetical protein